MGRITFTVSTGTVSGSMGAKDPLGNLIAVLGRIIARLLTLPGQPSQQVLPDGEGYIYPGDNAGSIVQTPDSGPPAGPKSEMTTRSRGLVSMARWYSRIPGEWRPEVLSAARPRRQRGWRSSRRPSIAHSCTRVYDRSMVRNCASFAFGLALIVALGFAMAHANPLKAPGGSTGFSTPCEPASPIQGHERIESGFDDRLDLRCRKRRRVSRRRERIPRRSSLAADSAPGARGLPSAVASAPAGQLLIRHRKGSRSRCVRERRSPPVLCIWS